MSVIVRTAANVLTSATSLNFSRAAAKQAVLLSERDAVLAWRANWIFSGDASQFVFRQIGSI